MVTWPSTISKETNQYIKPWLSLIVMEQKCIPYAENAMENHGGRGMFRRNHWKGWKIANHVLMWLEWDKHG